MMFLRMVVQQARHRWAVTLLLCLAMTALVSLYVYLDNSRRFTNRSMQLIMKNMGHNLLILPKEADPVSTYLCTDTQVVFPESFCDRMSARLELAARYYAAVLQWRVPVGGSLVIATGIRPVHRRDETAEKSHLVPAVPVGCVRLGSAAARLLGAQAGEDVRVCERAFRVAAIAEPLGTLDDYRVYMPLSEAQALLGETGKINAILAFLCLHGKSLHDVTAYQQAAMNRLFPGFKVISRSRIAQGRYMARRTTQVYLMYLFGIVLVITVVIIVVTGLQEVSERRQEVGMLLAMGAGYTYIVGMYVLKLLVLALIGSGVGFAVGSVLSRELLSPVLQVQTSAVRILWSRLPPTALMACAVAVAAAFLPIMVLVRMDPKAILTEE